MPPRFRKKITRQHGKKWHGWGAKKKHRGKGSRGGKGYGGSTKQKRSFIYAYEPEHFGHKGFFSHAKKDKIINIGDVVRMGKSSVDLSDFGYTKLLAKGKVASAITVKVAKCSGRAREKIEAAGGKVISEPL